MREYVLVVVDMQYWYKAARNHAVRKNIIKEVKKASSLNMPIIMVEMNGLGKTQPSIVKSVGNSFCSSVSKISCDGSDEVQQRIKLYRKRGILRSKPIVKITGIEMDVCVLETAEGLVEKGYSVHMLKNCCYGINDEACDTVNRSVKQLKRLKFL